jgi:Cytosine/uracil/thiamine/allantoin permeases
MLGWLIGSIIVALTTYITYKTGTTKDLVWREMFGRSGSRICSFLMAFCMGFWACYDLFNGGQALYNLMPDNTMLKNIGFCVAIFVLLVLTIIGGVSGVTGVKWISVLTVPVALVLFIIIYIASYNSAGGLTGLMEYTPAAETMGLGAVAHNMVGMWLAGFLGIMDLGTAAKNGKSVIIASIFGVAFIMLCYMAGQVGFIGTGMKTLGDICASLGGAIFFTGNLFVIFAQGNTTPACNFFYSNSFAHAFNLNSRKVIAIVVPILAAVLAFVIMYGPGVNFINNITATVSVLMGPLIAVTIAEYHFVSRDKFKIESLEKTPALRPTAVICLVVGLIISFSLRMIPAISIPSFIVIIVTGLLYVFLKRGLKLDSRFLQN